MSTAKRDYEDSAYAARTREDFERLEGKLERLRAAAGDGLCDVCGGTGKPLSDLPCVCGGSGTLIAQRDGLRRVLYDAERDLVRLREQLEQLRVAAQRVMSWFFGRELEPEQDEALRALDAAYKGTGDAP